MFCTGHWQLHVSKGYRLTLPQALFNHLAPQRSLTVTIDERDAHWLLYATEDWEQTVQPALVKSRAPEAIRRIGKAQPVQVSGSDHRFTLPPSVRGFGLRRFAVAPFLAALTSTGDRLELWPLQPGQQQRDAVLILPSGFAELHLDAQP